MKPRKKKIILYWENFGPMHIDRASALVRDLSMFEVYGIQISAASETYQWSAPDEKIFTIFTLLSDRQRSTWFRRIVRLTRAFQQIGKGYYFLCHYENVDTFLFATILRFFGCKVFCMNDSKFDDRKRFLPREFIKSLFLAPYNGAIAASYRSKDYFRFLGVPKDKIALGYDTISVARIRKDANSQPGRTHLSFHERNFISIARFVPKKNLEILIDAFAMYIKQVSSPRRLVLCGGGTLRPILENKAREMGIDRHIDFFDFLKSAAVAELLSRSLALILPSIEEQFGLVLIEAQALDIPVIASTNCGACDIHVRNGVNGFIIEPDNAVGLAFFLNLLGQNQHLWQKMAASSSSFAMRGDVQHFVSGIDYAIKNF